MEKIQKNLEVYLEDKRTEFPRFYLISNDELLQLLAEQKNLSSVEKHLNKLFDNINRLTQTVLQEGELQDDLNLAGMISSEGEEVQFSKPIKTRMMKGVEEWLGVVRKEMKTTIRRAIREALKELNKEQINRIDWILKHCGQAVNVVSKLKWTENVEEAITEMEDDSSSMYQLSKALKDDLSQLVDLIRKPDITSTKRKILVSLITQEVHG